MYGVWLVYGVYAGVWLCLSLKYWSFSLKRMMFTSFRWMPWGSLNWSNFPFCVLFTNNIRQFSTWQWFMHLGVSAFLMLVIIHPKALIHSLLQCQNIHSVKYNRVLALKGFSSHLVQFGKYLLISELGSLASENCWGTVLMVRKECWALHHCLISFQVQPSLVSPLQGPGCRCTSIWRSRGMNFKVFFGTHRDRTSSGDQSIVQTTAFLSSVMRIRASHRLKSRQSTQRPTSPIT